MGIKDTVKASLGKGDDGHTGWGEPKQREGESDADFGTRKKAEYDASAASTAATTAASIVNS